MHSVALGIAIAATMFAATAVAQTRLVTEQMMVKSPDPGIEIYVRNKRPADMTTFRPERTVLYVHGATYPASTAFDLQLGGMSWMDYIAARGLSSRSARLWQIHTPKGNVRRSQREPANRAWRHCGEGYRDGR